MLETISKLVVFNLCNVKVFMFLFCSKLVNHLVPSEVIRRHVIMKRITLSALLMTLFYLAIRRDYNMKHRLSERIKNFNITILISLFLLISCGSGQQPQAGKDGEAATGGSSLSAVMMHMERTAQDAFYAFMGLIADTLGLRVTKDTTKNDVGVYFKGLAGGIEKSIGELLAVSSKTDQSVQPVKEEKESELSKAIEGLRMR
ncbi:hypothetical protein BT0_T03 (plasmid) [Borrelia turicatae 91E135]|uniref:Variable large protein n=1 Tax=Borrelia turicatae (strain 91E135) TaxID=314724 RepID=A0ABF7R0B3_BORT9|nr:hypothetical protein BT0_T03 [Borrelia turicatae 91E135]